MDDDRSELAAALDRLRERAPAIDEVEVFAVDLNGILRGKRVPLALIEAMAEGRGGGLRFQVSLLGLDIFGADVPASEIAMEIGDPDGAFLPIGHTLAPAFGPEPALATLQGMIGAADGGGPAPFDPRGVLLAVLDRAEAAGLIPVAALELEFYLIDPVEAAPPRHPLSGARPDALQIMDLDALALHQPVLGAIRKAAKTDGIPVHTTLAEFGAGQFELTLDHRGALRACDDLIALKRLIRAAARAHGLDATFMAKPFGGFSGSGLHFNLSFGDRSGTNVFAAEDGGAGATLRHAVGGVLASAPDAFAIFAPHLNSQRRHRPGAYAPLAATWGLDNRGAAVRVPATRGPAARLEHRIAGADANPYLVAASVIAGALDGVARRLEPPPPSVGEWGEGPAFPHGWGTAVDRFASSEFIADWLGAPVRKVFAAMKRQEEAALLVEVSDVEHRIYLRRL